MTTVVMNALCSGTAYNAQGEVYTTTDNAGRVNLNEYDQQGRETDAIQNYSTTQSGPDYNIQNVTNYGAGQDVASTSVITSTSTQTTQYVYAATAVTMTPDLYCNNQVVAVIYADSTNSYSNSTGFVDGTQGYNRVQYTFDRQGETTTMEDQNQTLHGYGYDGAGRELCDSITVPTGNPANIDLTVTSIDDAYKVCGKLLTVTCVARRREHRQSGGNAV